MRCHEDEQIQRVVENYDDAVKLNPTFHAAKKRLHELEKRGIFPNSKIQSNIFFLIYDDFTIFFALHTNWWLKIKLVVVVFFVLRCWLLSVQIHVESESDEPS